MLIVYLKERENRVLVTVEMHGSCWESLFKSTEEGHYYLHSRASTDIRSIDLIRQLLLADIVPAIRSLERELVHREP